MIHCVFNFNIIFSFLQFVSFYSLYGHFAFVLLFLLSSFIKFNPSLYSHLILCVKKVRKIPDAFGNLNLVFIVPTATPLWFDFFPYTFGNYFIMVLQIVVETNLWASCWSTLGVRFSWVFKT